MANEIEYKYDGESDVEHEKDDYSCDSGISAIKFRKRLEQLQGQSKKLENLQFQLLTIKNANYITKLEKVCAISIIQESTRAQKNKKNKSNRLKATDYKLVFSVFTELETERAFNAVYTNNNFEQLCDSFWKDTVEAANSNNSLTCLYQLIETPYTLFRKTLNNKAIIFLMVGRHSSDAVDSYRILDILQSLIVDLCTSLQITPANKDKDSTQTDKQSMDRKLSLIAMIEIMDEVFGGNHLNETEFVICMQARIGMESVWKSNETEQKLQRLFQRVASESDESKFITFEDFVSYFSPFNPNKFGSNSPNLQKSSEERETMKYWEDIKEAVKQSPLSKRNRILREKESISASKYREKLNDIEKLINLLEESIIFNESKSLKKKASSIQMVENEQLFWRKKILQHREFVRFYQDVILHEIINENNKMKTKIDKLVKLNKFSKKVQYEENEWLKKNEHLLQIEMNYYELLKKQKHQQNTMKNCELLIQEKDKEIYRLKSQLIKMAKKQMNAAPGDTNNVAANEAPNMLNNKLLRLKGEIAQRKLEIEDQLSKITQNIGTVNHEKRNVNNKRNKLKQDRI